MSHHHRQQPPPSSLPTAMQNPPIIRPPSPPSPSPAHTPSTAVHMNIASPGVGVGGPASGQQQPPAPPTASPVASAGAAPGGGKNMLEVQSERPNVRRASLISEIYSENHTLSAVVGRSGPLGAAAAAGGGGDFGDQVMNFHQLKEIAPSP